MRLRFHWLDPNDDDRRITLPEPVGIDFSRPLRRMRGSAANRLAARSIPRIGQPVCLHAREFAV